MGKRDRKNGVPETMTSIPLVDPHAMPDNPSIGDLVKDATAQVSTLVRAEVELAKAEITRDVKKGLTGSVFFIIALVVLLYSTFFMFFFLAELLDTWLWRWAAFLVVFILMLMVTAVFAFLGYRKVRRIRGPQQTIESVKETTAALTPGLAKFAGSPSPATETPALDRPAPTPKRAPLPPRTSTRTTPVPAPATPPTPKPTPPMSTAAPVAEPEPEPGRTQPVYEYQRTDDVTPAYPEPEPTTTEYPTTEYPTTEYATTGHTATEYVTTGYTATEYTEIEDPEPESTATEYATTEYATTVYATTEYTGATVIHDEESTPTGDDPTAAIYADTRRPVTRHDDPLPGDPSGW